MMFKFNGVVFKIEFSRAKRVVKTYENGVEVEKESKHPFTTVELRKIKPEGGFEIVASASAGCSPEDQFTLEGGRLRALKKMTPDIPAEIRTAMWEAYHGREKGQPKKTPPSAATPVVPVFPLMAGGYGGYDLRDAPVSGWRM